MDAMHMYLHAATHAAAATSVGHIQAHAHPDAAAASRDN